MKSQELNDKVLLRDYLDNGNLNSLFQIVFVLHGIQLKNIIAKVLKQIRQTSWKEFLQTFMII